MLVKEILCKSILTPTTLASIEYTINPYFGCGHSCVYCYCKQLTKRFQKHQEPWGTYIDVKINAPEILKKQLEKNPKGVVWLSSATDPYQPIEKKYELTRKILDELSKSDLKTDILTKGCMATRDIDVFEKFKKDKIIIGATINVLDDRVRRDFEPFAAPIEKRIEQLSALRDAKIPIYASFGPVFPEFTDIHGLFKVFKELGITYAFTEKLNTRGENWLEIKKILENKYPELLPKYEKIFFDKKVCEEWHNGVKKQIEELAQRYGIKCDIYFEFREKFKSSSKSERSPACGQP
jgi:DNA repair photolyase